MSLYFDSFCKSLIVILCVNIAHTTFFPEPGFTKFSKDAPPVFTCVDNNGRVINADGNYLNDANCNQYFACGGGRLFFPMNCSAASQFYVPFGDFCGYAVNNQQCPNYWVQGAANEMGPNGCPTSTRYSGSAPMLVPTKDKADKCTTYLICKSTPVVATCPSGYFFSIQNFGCVDNYWKTTENCNE